MTKTDTLRAAAREFNALAERAGMSIRCGIRTAGDGTDLVLHTPGFPPGGRTAALRMVRARIAEMRASA